MNTNGSNRMSRRRSQGLYTVPEAADVLEVECYSLWYAIRTGVVPAPSHTIGDRPRKYYEIQEIEKMKGCFI